MTEVVNPYRTAIQGRWEASTDAASRLSQIVDVAVTELPWAWMGGTSQQVIAELQWLQGEAQAASRDVLEEFESAWSDQLPTVEDDAWQVRWRNLGPR